LAASAAAQPPLRITLPIAEPMGYRDGSGNPHGFVYDALEAAAARTAYKLDWVRGGGAAANDEALRNGSLDILLGFSSPERRREFFISDPWWSSELVAIVPADRPIRQEADLAGRALAIPGGASAISNRYKTRTVPSGSAGDAVNLACAGRADAGVFAAMFLWQILADFPPACRDISLRTIDLSFRLDYVLITRRDRSDPAIRLKSALDSITADGTLVSIAAKHPPVSTPQANQLMESMRLRYDREIWAICMGGAGGMIFLGLIFILRQSRARRRIQQSEARFRALFDAAPQAVVAVNRSGAIVFANRGSREIFGRDLVGTPAADLFPERHRRLLPGPAGPSEIAGLRADGAEFPAELRLSTVDTPDGLTLVFVNDISDRVALQRQLLQSQKLESVGLLAGGVAHDFNNLLTVISGYASMSLDQLEVRHFLREPLAEIALAAERAAELTRQLLAFSRRQAAKPKLLSLRELLLNLEKMLRRLIGEHINLIFDIGEIAPILADPGQIEQVVVNLVVNARDAMPNGGSLTISAHMADDKVLLCVTDTGVGMTPEVASRIFEPFFTTKELGKGTGLGLSTVYGIVKQAEGDLEVDTDIGRGTTFKILLPAAEGSPDAPAPAAPRLSSPGHETILIAEDEPGVRRFVREVLAESGYKVLEAANGREAAEVASRHTGPIHLLLTDIVMPEMGGLDLAARIRQLNGGVAILYMSGYSERPLDASLRQDLIEKPFTRAVLLQRVREALKRPPAASPPPNRP
jgi:PAS domain S-box-containing protein